MSGPKLYVAGNWKMNGLRPDLAQIQAIRDGIASVENAPDVTVFPPATLLHAASQIVEGSSVEIGAQDCHVGERGPFTGDLSALMLKESGATTVILGHSERRGEHGETSREVRAKAATALRAGVKIVVCIGETRGEHVRGLTASVCRRQLADSLPDESTPETTIVAYEPVWAIGSGVSPTTEQITAVHEVVRGCLRDRFRETSGMRWRVLYGGSVSPANAASTFDSPEVDGVLVGGASLKAATFLEIVTAAARASERRASLPTR
ncbi:triose-phosphate isomerase [Rhodomicrobium sp.]|uniref:triose-phosphate isomerase n=1 Tax=Rhodomicrobium sp. TaxID=2720632 RepID=UPI0039E54507